MGDERIPESVIDRINEASGLDLQVTHADRKRGIYDALHANPTYDIVVVHLSGSGRTFREGSNTYEFVERVRRGIPEFSGVLVAESSVMVSGRGEVSKYFKYHTKPLLRASNMVKLLQELFYLPQDFRLPD